MTYGHIVCYCFSGKVCHQSLSCFLFSLVYFLHWVSFFRIIHIVYFIYSYIPFSADTNNPCIRRDFGRSSFVCVCNATYCDNPPNVHLVNAGQAVLISSTRLNDRFQIQNLSFTSDSLSNTLIGTINRHNFTVYRCID